MNNVDRTDYCDSICWNLSESFDNRNIHFYRSINDWAVDFKMSNSRKPSVRDVRSFFNVRNIPQHADKSLFIKTSRKSSYLEDLFETELKMLIPGYAILKNRRPLVYKGSRFEIDFWVPELNLGFEVQDFDTHSKIEGEVSRYGLLKKGAEYSALKVGLAKEQLDLDLYEIWEDEILSSDFSSKLKFIILRVSTSLSSLSF